MTFVFFLGLLAVFIPIGLGFTLLTQSIRQFHNTIFLVGGIFLTLLGLGLTIGFKFPLPSPVHPRLTRYDAFGIFGLGVFSAIATTCCAPVLAGVLALSTLGGSYLASSLYILTFVLGMVVPLFILSTILDKTNATQKIFAWRKPLTFRLFGVPITNSITNLLAGITFLVMGITVAFLSLTNRLAMRSSYQLQTNLLIAEVTKWIGQYTNKVPEAIWAVLFLTIFILIITIAVKQFVMKNNKKEVKHT